MQPPGWQQPPAPEEQEEPGSQAGWPARHEGVAEPALQPLQEDRRYEDFLRSSIDWLWETDAQLTLTYASSPIALKLGIPAQVLVGRPFLSLGRFQVTGGSNRAAGASIEARRPFRNQAFIMTGAEAHEVTYRLSGVPYFDDATGNFAGYRGTAIAAPQTAQDTAASNEEAQALSKALEEVLVRYQDLSWRHSQATRERKPPEAPRETSQETSREHPLARTAHELRTPLNAIVGYADLALQEVFGPLSERYQDCFKTIREAGHHLDKLVSQLQDTGNPDEEEALANEIVAVASVVAKAKAIVALAAKSAEVDISRVGPMAGGRVIGDRVSCTQILVNLLTNAVKFTPTGGSVGLETLVGPENMLQIVVWDTGIGIPVGEQAKIFNANYRATHSKPAHGAAGSGLGLAISRDLARTMGGDLTVSSQPGEGSRFVLSLPLVAEPVPSSN